MHAMRSLLVRRNEIVPSAEQCCVASKNTAKIIVRDRTKIFGAGLKKAVSPGTAASNISSFCDMTLVQVLPTSYQLWQRIFRSLSSL
jgi:hypothetical protein